MTEKHFTPNPEVLAEIDDQYVADLNAGQGPGTLVTTVGCYGVSWALGNDGNFCTGSVECQGTCG